MRRHFKASLCLPVFLACVVVGCRTPNWSAPRFLRTVPSTSDASSSRYFEGYASNPSQSGSEKSVTPASELDSKDGALIRAAPAIRLASHPQSESTRQKGRSEDKDRANEPLDKQATGPLKLPSDLPGSDTPPISLSRRDADGEQLDGAKLKENILKLYSDLPVLPDQPDAFPDEANGQIGLENLQNIAHENHPGLRAAAASVEAARGLMIQAGLPPNPNVGYQADTVRTNNTLGYHGIYMQQTFITAQKLGLAAQAAAVDYSNAMVAQRKAYVTVQSSVRRSYFQVLASRKRVVLAKALAELSENAYHSQIKLVIAGEAAPYEPLQLRVLTTQARATLIRAQQDSIAAWRTLAATVATPSLQPMSLEGEIDNPVPEIDYDTALARMAAVHTDLQTAENLIAKNRTLVALADRVLIPDLNVGLVVQRDYTFTPGTNTYNLSVGGAVPVWNKNQGNRVAARAELVKSVQTVSDTQNQLIAKLAPMFGTYQANRQLAQSFKTEALADQVRAYRGVYQRYLTDPSGISFNDVIVAQQTLGNVLNQYVDILQAQWQSTVDLSELLQAEDMFQMGEPIEVAEIPAI